MTNQLDKKSQAWSALFSEPMSELVKRYTASVFFDKRLWQADIQGSLAHADMLATQGIISANDLADIQRGMAQITGEKNRLESNPALARSIRHRFPYIDPLHHLQVELIRRYREGKADERVQRGIHISINGIAAGLRNTG